MPDRTPTPEPHPAAVRHFSPLAAVLSYLVPGLGQMYQGRVSKGLLFFILVPGLFFTGMWLGSGKNVYLPDTTGLPRVSLGWFGRRVPVEGPFKALYYRVQFLGQFWIGAAAWPAMWQYATYDPHEKADPVLGTFERAPSESELNTLQQNGDKRWDLAWVYTVIAGVLNILVIYDAFAGPLFQESKPKGVPQEARA